MQRSDKPPVASSISSSLSPIRLLVVDRSPLVLEGTVHALSERGCHIIGQASSVAELDTLWRKLEVSDKVVLLVGPLLHIADGFAACRWARDQATPVRVVFITDRCEDPLVLADAARLRVTACLPVDVSLDDLFDVIKLAWLNQSLLPPAPPEAEADQLTECELRVLQKLARGQKLQTDRRRIADQRAHRAQRGTAHPEQAARAQPTGGGASGAAFGLDLKSVGKFDAMHYAKRSAVHLVVSKQLCYRDK